MSADKHRSLGRRLALLRRAKSAADGHIEFGRTDPCPKWSKWSKRFQEAPMRSWCSTDYIRRSYAAITAAGREFLAKHGSA